jgi:predicted HTH domain antitoxin
METLSARTVVFELLPGLSADEARETFAAALLAEGKASISQGAKIAGLSRRDFVAAMRRRKLHEALEDAADVQLGRIVLAGVRDGTIKTYPLEEVRAEIAAKRNKGGSAS